MDILGGADHLVKLLLVQFGVFLLSCSTVKSRICSLKVDRIHRVRSRLGPEHKSRSLEFWIIHVALHDLLFHGSSSILHGNNHRLQRHRSGATRLKSQRIMLLITLDWKDLTFHFFPHSNSSLASESISSKAVLACS